MNAGVIDTIDHALDLAARGWHVFPAPAGEKESHKSAEHSNGRRWGASTDPTEIKADFTRWPKANLGVVTGKESGLLVIDVDTQEDHAHDGVTELARLIAKHGPFPETVEAATPTGGRHLFFSYPRGELIQNSAGQIAPGIDVRAEGGMAVVPPSRKPDGRQYTWTISPGMVDLAECPEWLLVLVRKPERKNAPPQPRTGRLSSWGEAAIEGVLADLRKAHQGERNTALNKAAFRLGQIAGAGQICDADAIPHLRGTAQAIGLDAAEIEATIRSGWEAGLVNPRGPEDRQNFTNGTSGGEHIDPETGEIYEDEPASEPKPKGRSNGETSEDQIARAFALRHHKRLRFDHSAGRWYEWAGARWQRNETKLAFHFARLLSREASDGKKGFCKASVANGVEAFARADPMLAVTADVWDRDRWLLGTPGGTVDLRTGQLMPARQVDLITKQTGTAPEHGEPGRWLRFLLEATAGDRELIRFLQQVAGYCLTGSTCEHALFFIYGPGGNGKSVFLNLLNYVLGDYATTAGMETFTASKNDRHPTDLAMLNRARLVSASETEEGRAWAESRIKQVTDGDKVSARFMRQDFFEFVPQFKLVIVGNHAPVLANVDEAARRRFNIIPFTHKPVTPDRELEDKLKAEAGQILSWAIAGCLDWQANGLVRPEIVTAATADYFEDQDLFGQWIDDHCARDPGKWELPTPLYNNWADYARAAGDDPGTQRAMSSKLKRAGFQPRKLSGGIRTYQGITLKKSGGFNGTGY